VHVEGSVEKMHAISIILKNPTVDSAATKNDPSSTRLWLSV